MNFTNVLYEFFMFLELMLKIFYVIYTYFTEPRDTPGQEFRYQLYLGKNYNKN